MSALQSWPQVAVLLVGIGAIFVAAIVYQTHYIDKRIESLRNELRADIAGLRAYINAKFEAVEAHFKSMETRLGKIEDRLERSLTRP